MFQSSIANSVPGITFFRNAMHTLHTRYPMGTVERLPVVKDDGSTAVPGVFVVGDLAGPPLLKFSQNSGSRIVDVIKARGLKQSSNPGMLDVAIIGGGVSGISAAMECKRAGLFAAVFEAGEIFSTIRNFPRAKPIFLYPTEMSLRGDLRMTADVKEDLVEELDAQVEREGIDIRSGYRATHIERTDADILTVQFDGKPAIVARNVVVAMGRSGGFRRMNVPGEDGPLVVNRLHDPGDFRGKRVLVVGGGDTAAEAAIALVDAGAEVTLSHRGSELSRPKHENVAGVLVRSEDERLRLLLGSRVTSIGDVSVKMSTSAGEEELAVDQVFVLIGREAPLDFFRRSGVPISGEITRGRWIAMSLFLLFCVFLYDWKGVGFIGAFFQGAGLFPYNTGGWFEALSVSASDPATLIGTLKISMSQPSFYYTLAYSLVVVIFGVRRIRRRKTPYITIQTVTLALIQVLPLFILPEIILPLLGHNGFFSSGFLQTVANGFFPEVDYGHGREYWRAYGFILAWPLMVYNWFTYEPLWWWIGFGIAQLGLIFVLIYYYGKGAYCGWICSCGALAETLGDEHRQKMPHGPFWTKLNMAGQVILWIAIFLLGLKVLSWIVPGLGINVVFDLLFAGQVNYAFVNPVNYKWIVDVGLAGILGVGLYFWYSGRVWCRFFCPLAAMMHWMAKVTSFRILADKKKCISCNVCTSVCHQGIDVMAFANKGLPMEDPQCVRCAACVHSCPTGVLEFGRVDRDGKIVAKELIPASPVRMVERARGDGGSHV